jgi:hypothetical protein
MEPFKAPTSGDDYIRMLNSIGKLPPAIFTDVEGVGNEICITHGDFDWTISRRGHDWHVEAYDDSHDFLAPFQAIDFVRDEIGSLLREEKTVTADVFAADPVARGIKDVSVHGNKVLITHQGRKLVAKPVSPKRKGLWDVIENGASILKRGPMIWHWAAHEISMVGVDRKPWPMLKSDPGIDAVVAEMNRKAREPKICRLSDFPAAVANTLVPPTTPAPVATVPPVAVRWMPSPSSLDSRVGCGPRRWKRRSSRQSPNLKLSNRQRLSYPRPRQALSGRGDNIGRVTSGLCGRLPFLGHQGSCIASPVVR